MMDDETLILTVGGTPRPLEVAIEQIKPKFVYFIHSKETLKTVEEILENVSFDLEYSLVKIDDPESLSEAFDKSNDLMARLEGEIVHINFTGGTKPMVAGLMLASSGSGCIYSYVGSKSMEGRAKDGAGLVLEGFETLKVQKDPNYF